MRCDSTLRDDKPEQTLSTWHGISDRLRAIDNSILTSYDQELSAMKGITRTLLFHLTVALAVTAITPTAVRAENPFTAMWPFKKSNETKTFTQPPMSDGNSLFNGPSRLMEKAEQQTGSLVKKTKSGWHELRVFGRSMNPFSKPKPNKKSFLDTVFPKKPVDNGPATVGEFLDMKRPGFR